MGPNDSTDLWGLRTVDDRATGSSTETNGSVLVVDDDRSVRDMIREILGADGYRVFEAGDGLEMERQLQNHKIDLVILDLVLPGPDGNQLAMQL